MLRIISRTILIFIISMVSSPLMAQEGDFNLGDFICPESEGNLDAGDDFYFSLDLSLVMMAGFVHINRTNAGTPIDSMEGCVLATVELDGDDEIVIIKFLDVSGEFASHYQFILMSEIETGNMIALNSFRDVDAVAHELEMIAPEERLYHLDEIGPDYIATHELFVGRPSVNQLIYYVLGILNDESAALVTVDMSGEETGIIIREDLLEDDEEE